jgi:hypothetical protein
MEYQNVGRGGAGNYYSQQDTEDAKKPSSEVSGSEITPLLPVYGVLITALGSRKAGKRYQSNGRRPRKVSITICAFWSWWRWKLHRCKQACKSNCCHDQRDAHATGDQASYIRTLWQGRSGELSERKCRCRERGGCEKEGRSPTGGAPTGCKGGRIIFKGT